MSNNPTNPPKPFQPINWPKTNTNTQLQQVKAAGISSKPNTAQPASPAGVSPTTQGQPKSLTNIQVTKTAISATQYQLTVSFNRDPTDPYYTHTVIHIQQGSNTPVQVGAGTTSPIKVVVNKSQTPTTVIAQAVGNWGQVPVSSSPVQTVSLSDISPAPVNTISSNPGSGITGNFPANQVYASPSAGGSGPLAVRSLATADIPFLPASIITTGTLALAVGGTAANLSLTGGAHQVLMQTSVGGAVTVAQLAFTDISGTITLGSLPGSGALTVTAGTNLTGGGSVALGGSTTLNLSNTPNLTTVGVLSFNADTGISRDSAGVIAIGNGTQDDITGTLVGGRINLTQPANSGDVYKAKRNTDTTPAGNFIHFISAAAADLFTVDITGTLTAGSVPNARLAGSGALTVTAGTNLTGGGSVALGGSTTLNLSNTPNLTTAGVLSWNSDVGISRDSAGVLAIGNGTQDDFTGFLGAAQFLPIQATNGVAMIKGQRQTDTGPTGNFIQLQNHAKTVDQFDVNVSGVITQYNAQATAGNGMTAIMGVVDLTAQAASIAAITIFTTPAAGFYRFQAYIVETQAATGTTPSSTLPAVNALWTDEVTAQSLAVTATKTNNSPGVFQIGDTSFYAASGAAIKFSTTGYTSVGTTTPMLYSIHVRVEAL